VPIQEVDPPRSYDVPRSLLDEAATLPGALEALVESYPDFECLIFLDRLWNEERFTVSQLWKRVGDVQAYLLEHGLEPGRAVILILPTSFELAAAYFGVILAGGTPALEASPSNRFADLRVYAKHQGRILGNADAQFLYCDEAIAEIFTGDARDELGESSIILPADVPQLGNAPTPREFRPEDVTTIQYSSGSTGTPKGILLSHQAMLNNIRDVRDGLDLKPADVSVNWIPLYHDMGLIDAFLLPLLCGCPTVLIPTMDFMSDPILWLRGVHLYRGALSWAPNFAYTLCSRRISDKQLEGLDLSCWRIAINAAEPVLAKTIATFTERFQAYGFAPEAMTPAWGLAENVTIATAHPLDEPPLIEVIDRDVLAREGRAEVTDKDGLSSVAIGRCLPRCEVEIRDESGTALTDRDVGEVWLRTDSLFDAYKSNAELTGKMLVDGWLNTGDRGYLLDGHLFFVSRGKDLIIIGGENYAPHDIETIINRVSGVREGCGVAFGVMSEMRGTEDLAAVVETRVEGEDELDDLARRIRAEVMHVTGLAVRHLKLVGPGGINKTTSGKLARRATRERYASDFGPTVG
jgi:fatty-acyl-CoA synthase